MSSPLVAGVAAKCFAAGDCKLGDETAGGGLKNRARILDSIVEKHVYDEEYAWNIEGGGTTARVPKRGVNAWGYYGYLVWAGKW